MLIDRHIWYAGRFARRYAPPSLLPLVRLLLGRQLQGPPQGGDTWGFPFLPHLVHHVLDVLDVLLDNMGEAALLHEVFPHWHPLFARVVGINHLAIDDLIQRKDPRADAQLAQLMGIPGVVVPALGTGVEAMDEGGAADSERLADFIQKVQGRESSAGRGHIAAGGRAPPPHTGAAILSVAPA